MEYIYRILRYIFQIPPDGISLLCAMIVTVIFVAAAFYLFVNICYCKSGTKRGNGDLIDNEYSGYREILQNSETTRHSLLIPVNAYRLAKLCCRPKKRPGPMPMTEYFRVEAV